MLATTIEIKREVTSRAVYALRGTGVNGQSVYFIVFHSYHAVWDSPPFCFKLLVMKSAVTILFSLLM